MSVIHETGLITAPVPVYFETFAPAAATGRATVVMVHGGAHSGACYQRTADGRRGWAYLFAERGYRSVVPDWPGTGRSGYIPLDRLNGATVIEGLGTLIRSLGAPVILMTHSMSGCYGWRLLELHGDIIDRLVGVAPGPPGNIQKAAPVYAETEREIETEASGQRVRIDKSAPVVPSSRFRGTQAHRCEPIFPARAHRRLCREPGPDPAQYSARAAERARPSGAA
jgi:pimeloyl-ACP methyl ester carboxylesterase